ncbi:MAG: hypothetical protein Q8Q67_01470 [bacterium]|nr:hypothetical protein [bacterium]
MSSARNSSIYILTAVLLLVGIMIFVFKGKLLAYMSNEVFGEQNTSVETVLQPSAASLVDVKILSEPSFTRLSDAVLFFDFNRVGKPMPGTGASIQPPAWQAVYLGNNSPFIVVEKKQ